MNYLDLFSGIGGFHLGLKMAGFQFDKVFYSEIDNYANKVYEKNFPGAAPLGDITKINPETLPAIDIVTGGFPCQDISVAGKQKGIEGERSSLFHEIIRLCSVLRPRVMFLENVPNLITGESGLWFKTVMESIASIGYNAEWEIISASEVGAPHLRRRIWLVAYPWNNSDRTDTRTPREKAGPSGSRRKTRHARVSCRTSISAEILADTECITVERNGAPGEQKPNVGQQNLPLKRGQQIIRERGNWSIEPNVGRVANGISNRVDRLKCLGNAVVPQVVQLIGEMILESGILAIQDKEI